MLSPKHFAGRVWRRLRGYRLPFTPKELRCWERSERDRLREFQDRHAGQSCFIIGNGPSLNQMDLTRLRGRTCFGLNKIYLHPRVREFGIDYHVAINPLVIEQSFEEFKTLDCPSFLSFVPSFRRNLIDSNFYYLIMGGPPRFSPDPYSPIFEGYTVTFVAMQLAYFMGFVEVFLIGVDHSFSAKGRPHAKQKLKGRDNNHFHPDYFRELKWQLPDLKGSEASYRLAKEYYEQNSRQIYDATVGGKLDVFPKIEFDAALRRCQRV